MYNKVVVSFFEDANKVIMCLLTDNQHLTFRGNSIGTKAMEAYMKLVGEKVGTQTSFRSIYIE